MKIAQDGGTSELVLAAEMQEFIHKLSTELAKDERLVERDSRRAELQQGLEAARQMHEKADAMRRGAIVGGLITMAGAGVQIEGATKVGSSESNISKQGEALVSTGSTTAGLGDR